MTKCETNNASNEYNLIQTTGAICYKPYFWERLAKSRNKPASAILIVIL